MCPGHAWGSIRIVNLDGEQVLTYQERETSSRRRTQCEEGMVQEGMILIQERVVIQDGMVLVVWFSFVVSEGCGRSCWLRRV